MFDIATSNVPLKAAGFSFKRHCRSLVLVLIGMISCIASAAGTDKSAQMAANGLLLDLHYAGDRMVAVGERGHIIYSDSQGEDWKLAKVPVRATLTSLSFTDSRTGWAAGHEGVILKTLDGGLNWRQVLDGHQANHLIIAALEQAQTQGQHPDPETLEFMLDDALAFADEGASRPFLDIHFLDSERGFALGAYGLFFSTRDGGDSWAARPLALDNPDLFHLNQLTRSGPRLYIAGEAGTLFVSEDEGVSWDLMESPYEGTFFGIAPLGADQVLAFGLRGNAYRLGTNDEWHPVDTGTDQSLFGALPLSEGGLLLLGNSGLLLTLDAKGHLTVRHQTQSKFALLAALKDHQGRLILAGSRGIESMEAH